MVIKVDADKAKKWSDKEVLIQWHKGFKDTLLTHKYQKEEDLNSFEQNMATHPSWLNGKHSTRC
ncbi:hypothetical protein [Shewanella litoralis]|uniref:Uncharacterized protein n=1 Tax=Shewanella litoralis TaxID=2282700 RepID=A0ABQ2RJV2_9GAMM|nr:hypothetical protein [Shewanella litoralis]GGQ36388.1 hypothetical protein GCM10009411_39220 [Shewanella litoralis]